MSVKERWILYIFFLLHIVLFFTSLFLVIVPLLFQKFSFLRTNLLFQFSSIYAKTRRSYERILSFFPFKNFLLTVYPIQSRNRFRAKSRITFHRQKKKRSLVLSRYVRTNSPFPTLLFQPCMGVCIAEIIRSA